MMCRIFSEAYLISLSSLVTCLLQYLAHFLIELFIFLALSIRSLCVLDNSPLSDLFFVNISSKSVACHLNLLTLSFAEQKFVK